MTSETTAGCGIRAIMKGEPMSRLIDADALHKRIKAKNTSNAMMRVMKAECLAEIDDAPTIVPERKTGKWIERNPQNSDKCRLIECDQCGFSHIVGFNVPYEHWIENRNFCERCGADMRGEQND